jgi:hypothetical protein
MTWAAILKPFENGNAAVDGLLMQRAIMICS